MAIKYNSYRVIYLFMDVPLLSLLSPWVKSRFGPYSKVPCPDSIGTAGIFNEKSISLQDHGNYPT